MIRSTLIFMALLALPVSAQDTDQPFGRYEIAPNTLADGSPSVWLVDTASGRIALCSYQNVSETGGTTSTGVEWSVSELTCTPWKHPDPDPLGILD